MKTLTLIALTTLITLSSALPSQAVSNPSYPQDRTWDLADQDTVGSGS